MAGKPPRKIQPRHEGKKRTREHILADLSVAHVQTLAVAAGFTAESTTSDYGYDLIVNTFDAEHIIEPGSILIQLKASEVLEIHASGTSHIFDLDVRDYNLWKREPNPVYLILYEGSTGAAYWLYFQRYLNEIDAPTPRSNARTLRVRVPKANVVDTTFFPDARRTKIAVCEKIMGADPHA